MSNTIIRYVKEYGDNTFMSEPMNDVDSLVLCQFCYLKFDGLVPFVSENKPSVTLDQLAKHENYESLFSDTRFGKENKALFEAMLGSKRFGRIKINCYVTILESEWETQFAAVTFLLEDGTIYVAFRGTDESLVGWKEDFNMAYLSPIPAQEYSAKYLNIVADRFRCPFYVGGHSKGGNLAVYSAMNCRDYVQDRILRVYSLDGPGFKKEVRDRCGYERIAERVVRILPESSVVGMLFEFGDECMVVESKAFGLLQHDPYTWRVVDGKFVYTQDISKARKKSNDILNEWLMGSTEEEMRTFVDTLYKVVCAADAENLIDFAANWRENLKAVFTAFHEVDKETEKVMREVVASLFRLRFAKLKGKGTKARSAKSVKKTTSVKGGSDV